MSDDESSSSDSNGSEAESEPLLDPQTITNSKDPDSESNSEE